MDTGGVKFDLESGEATPMGEGFGNGNENAAALKVKVACRIRPLIKRDLVGDYQIAITPDLNTNQVEYPNVRFGLEIRRGSTLTKYLTWKVLKFKFIMSAPFH